MFIFVDIFPNSILYYLQPMTDDNTNHHNLDDTSESGTVLDDIDDSTNCFTGSTCIQLLGQVAEIYDTCSYFSNKFK